MPDLEISSDKFGLNTHNFPNEFENDPQKREYLEKLLVDLGVKWIRAEVSWFEIEHPENTFHYEPVDKIIQFAQRYNINILFVLAKTPSFYEGGDSNNHLNEKYVDKWCTFVRNMVSKYKGSIKHWNIWNEPNLKMFWQDNRENFIHRVLKPAFEEIKSTDSSAKICGPELSSARGSDPKGWLWDITNAGVFFDILSHHQYDGGDKPKKRFKELMTFYNYALEKCNYPVDTELWLTETGWEASKFCEKQIARKLMKMMKEMASPKGKILKKIFWYCWRDPRSTKKWGLLHQGTDTPTLAYNNYKQAIYS